MHIRKRGDEIFKKSSPLKPQNRFESNLAEMFIGWSYTRILFLAHFSTGPPNDHSCKVTIQLT
jgi:GTP-dependent phosphoenolpyruvate carboxykinase